MKHKKILGIFGIVLILSLLLAIAPASPAFGAAMTLTSSSGKVGNSVTVIGTDFVAGTTVGIYFSNQAAAAGGLIGTSVTVYQFVLNTTIGASSTTFATAFTVPATMTYGGNIPVTAGTYYLYLCYLSGANPNTIVLVTPFTVIGNPAITISPTTGAAGASVTITGTDFTPSTILTIRFDSTVVAPTAGQTSTLSTGAFSSTITVPATTSGAHTITATAGTSTASATFTASASASLDTLSPATGLAGTDVVITGSNFPANIALAFKIDSTTLTRKSGDSATRSSGIFISTVTIPTGVTAGAHTIAVTAGTASASGTYTVIAPATLDELSPTSGRGGTDITVSGSNFAASTTLAFKFDTTAITPKSGDTATRSSGIFSAIITVPSSATVGAHTITVTAGSDTATKTYTVTAPPTSLSISSNGDTIGSLIGIGGAGFQQSAKVTVTYDGEKVAGGNVDTAGFFVVTFQVPASIHGNHIISATDGINSENITFTVESTPPSVPIPLAPAMGASIKSPYLFDWNDVTDVSAPVTYELQIATAADFAANSIIFNKTGLKESQYKLTEAEALQLSGNVAAYYWRERAVDAAANASAWTGAGQFSVAKPFKFVGWPLYLTIGVGAVVFFLLGLWVGRRSAFSY